MTDKDIEIAKAAGSYAEDATGSSCVKAVVRLLVIGWPFVFGACCIIMALAALPEV